MLFSPGDYKLAQAMIGVYFGLFRALINSANRSREAAARAEKEKEEAKKLKKMGKKGGEKVKEKKSAVDLSTGSLTNKMLSALLVGVNRAFPYATAVEKASDAEAVNRLLEEHVEMMFGLIATATAAKPSTNTSTSSNISNTGGFATVVQTLMLLYQVMTARQAVTDRFYSVLYKTLLIPEVLTSSKQMLYLNLLFKTIKNDKNEGRALAFVKRMLQVTKILQPYSLNHPQNTFLSMYPSPSTPFSSSSSSSTSCSKLPYLSSSLNLHCITFQLITF